MNGNNLSNNVDFFYHIHGNNTLVQFFLTKRGILRPLTVLVIFLCLLFLTACKDEVLYEVEVGEEAALAANEHTTDEEATYTAEVQLEIEEEEQYIIVHLCGAVVNPGVYELKQGARVVDGVKQAGGFLEEASEEGLNLASPLLDGTRIYIPTEAEIEEAKTAGSISSDGTYADAFNAEGQTASGAAAANGLNSSASININTADEAALTTLPGIGPARAKAIIEYREANGGFKAVEDIKNVSGIGEASFQKLKSHITVN